MADNTAKRFSAKWFVRFIPWLITCLALYYAFRGINWRILGAHIGGSSPNWLFGALVCTSVSYLLRARRWQFLFPKWTIAFPTAFKVLILGFFMNNILPARTGEFVRAHLGAKVTGETRTLFLATIASERLVDGLTLSIMFLLFALGLGNKALSENLMYVALIFAIVAIMVVATLIQRSKVYTVAEKISQKFQHKASSYTLNRIQVFIDGLTPLSSKTKLPLIALWSIIIWVTELAVYYCVSQAFDANLSIPFCVLFLVTVNFSSLIPAAPGGLGVIEAIATTVLVSIGIEKEHALSMVISQHIIQYIVVGVPGALIMLNWKNQLGQIEPIQNGTS